MLKLEQPDQGRPEGEFVIRVSCDCCGARAPATRRTGRCRTGGERDAETRAAAREAGAALFEAGWRVGRHGGAQAHACNRCVAAGPDWEALCKCAGHPTAPRLALCSASC
jgi:hypothetical protein